MHHSLWRPHVERWASELRGITAMRGALLVARECLWFWLSFVLKTMTKINLVGRKTEGLTTC